MNRYVPYYYDNTQLFRMPPGFQSTGAFEQDSAIKALPYIALGIAGIVAYNMFVKGKRRA